ASTLVSCAAAGPWSSQSARGPRCSGTASSPRRQTPSCRPGSPWVLGNCAACSPNSDPTSSRSRRSSPPRAIHAARCSWPTSPGPPGSALMYSYLRGIYKGHVSDTDEAIVVEVAGIGYEVFVPPIVAQEVSATAQPDDELQLYVSAQAGRDQPWPVLFGFLTPQQKAFWQLLTSVP